MQLKPPLGNSHFRCISSLLKGTVLALDDEDMADCTHESDSTICHLFEESFFLKGTFVNEELPETDSSPSSKVLSKASLCNTPCTELAAVLDVSLEASNVEDIYFEDDYLQDYNYSISNQSAESIKCPQSSLTHGIECINHKDITHPLVFYDDYIWFDRYENGRNQGCDPWAVICPFLSLKLRQESINSFHVIPENNLSTKGKEFCSIKQSSRRKHHSAPDNPCHEQYSLSCCQETQSFNSTIEEILSNSPEGLQIAFDCSLMDGNIFTEDLYDCACPLQNDVEKCVNNLCRCKLQENVQPASDTLFPTNSDLKLLSDFSVVYQNKYKRNLLISSASTFISNCGLDKTNCIITDTVDNKKYKMNSGSKSSVTRLFHCNELKKQFEVYGRSNDKMIESISSVFENNVPTPNRFPFKESVLVCISSNDWFLNQTLNFEFSAPECKLVIRNRMKGLQQILYILYVLLIAAILVPINSCFPSATHVNRNILLPVTNTQLQYTASKGHFMNPNKKHTRKKTSSNICF